MYYCPVICLYLCLYRVKENKPSWLASHDRAVIHSCINTMSCKTVESLCLFIRLLTFNSQGGRSPRSAEEKPEAEQDVAHGTTLGVYYGYLNFSSRYHSNTTRWSRQDHACTSPEISVASTHCRLLLQPLGDDRGLYSSAFPHRS